jgi:hypothetical protein
MNWRFISKAKTIAIITAVVIVAAIAIGVVSERRRTRSEFGAAVSALISEGAHNWVGREVLIVLQQEAKRPGATPVELGRLARFQWFSAPFPQSELITRASFVLTNATPSSVQVPLELAAGVKLVTMSRRELGRQSRNFDALFPGNLGFFALSQAGFNAKKTEVISTSTISVVGCAAAVSTYS